MIQTRSIDDRGSIVDTTDKGSYSDFFYCVRE
jgi:hypothetical protein